MSCSNEFSKYNYVNLNKLNEPEKVKQLKSSVIVDKQNLNLITEFEIIDKYIIAIDRKSEKAVKIFDIKTGKLVKMFGRKGQGPSEFVGVSDIIRDPNDKIMFWVFDYKVRLIKKFSLKNIFNDNYKPIKIIKLSYGMPLQIIITKNNHIYATAITAKGRILEYDEKGKLIRRIGKIPVKFENKGFAKQHSQGFLGRIICKKNELFLATLYGSLIERYDIKTGELLNTYYGPELFFPEYDIVPVGRYYTITDNKKSRFGYLDINYNNTKDEIFLLYSGISSFKRKGFDNESLPRTVYVMNNSGDLIEKLSLDRGVNKIKVSEDCSTIYGADSDEIFKFKYIKN